MNGASSNSGGADATAGGSGGSTDPTDVGGSGGTAAGPNTGGQGAASNTTGGTASGGDEGGVGGSPATCNSNDTRPCFTGDLESLNVGTCKAGTETCISDQWGPCENEVLPQEEVCDGFDNDCNGIVDEGCSCANDDVKPCYTGAAETAGVGLCAFGIQTCADGVWGPCTGDVTPVPELCDGEDNNCDGNVDEGNPEGGAECDTELDGICAIGEETCSGGTLVCQAVNEAADQEVCGNGLDDNCDGNVDEGCGDGCAVGWTGPSCDVCVIYVDGASGNNANAGSSWGASKQDISAGIFAAAANGCEVWVSAGTYLPAYKPDPFGPDNTATIPLDGGVVLRGSFAPGEVDPSTRDFDANATVISGEIGDVASLADNLTTVVNATGTNVLDGVVIRDGRQGIRCVDGMLTVTNAQVVNNRYSSGIRTDGCNLTLTRSVLRDNRSTSQSSASAGGILFNSSELIIEDSSFFNNRRTSGWTHTGGIIHMTGGNDRRARIERSHFEGGFAESYGGVYLNANAIEIIDSTFRGNQHGAAYVSTLGGNNTALIDGCVFESNVGEFAALSIAGNATVVDSQFIGNINYNAGGAIYVSTQGTRRVIRSHFESNRANGNGGAIFSGSSNSGTPQLLISSSSFIANTTSTCCGSNNNGGGAISTGAVDIAIQSSIFAFNETAYANGGAIHLSNQATNSAIVDSSTFFANGAGTQATTSIGRAGALYNRRAPITLTNSIFWENHARIEAPHILNEEPSAVTTMYHTNVGGSGFSGGQGNIDVDPLFRDEDQDTLDLRLSSGSMCIDAGNAGYLSLDYNDLDDDGNVTEPLPHDFDGQSRVRGSAPDMGAFEY